MDSASPSHSSAGLYGTAMVVKILYLSIKATELTEAHRRHPGITVACDFWLTCCPDELCSVCILQPVYGGTNGHFIALFLLLERLATTCSLQTTLELSV